MQNLQDREYAPWLLTALLIPLTEAASGGSWLTAAVVTTAGTIISGFGRRKEPAEWLKCLQGIWAVLILTQLLADTHTSWKGNLGEYAVPLVLLMLAVLTVWNGAKQAARGINILRYGVIAVAAIVLLTGVKEIDWERMLPVRMMDNGKLFLLSVFPIMGGKRKGRAWIPVYTVIASVIIGGIIGEKVTLWEYSKSIGIFGMRLESITAMASTVSYYALISYLMAQCGKEWRSVIGAVAGYAGYMVGIKINMYILVIGVIVLWGTVTEKDMKKNFKNFEKRC